MKHGTLALSLALTALIAGSPANAAKLRSHPLAEAQTLDLAKRAIALRSVAGPDNKTPEVAALFKQALVDGGFAADDIGITPFEDTAYMIARWPGSDSSLEPLVISGHLDVVEAKPEDWERDPFTPVVENGYLFGRGATDMKFDAALATASLIEMKRQGYEPKRTIILEFSGDEETTMKTSAIIAERLKATELVLNIDGGGGTLDEATGKPRWFTWQGAEKTYADFELSVTNPGGHSSMPRRENAINELAAALVRIAQYRFTPELSPLTKSYFENAAPLESDPARAAAMRAFAANAADAAAIETLSADPAMVGRIGTTCIATMLSGGHALNALPQKATANINCRIFPGRSPASTMAELRSLAGDKVTVRDVTEGSVSTRASPLRADFVNAVTKAMAEIYPDVPVFPSMASGASDSMWFRANCVDSYGASPVFSKDSEEFSHGLNERIPLSNIAPGINYFISLFTDLSK
jgi:carboxypeptidase PM20D1